MDTGAIRVLVFKRGLARQAEVIRLREGETANLKLRISPWFEQASQSVKIGSEAL